MPELDFHCRIDEGTFSVVVFLTRLVVSLVLIYTAIGGLLYYREFLYNAAAVGWPMPIETGIFLLVLQIILALVLMLGWFTRLVSVLSVICLSLVGLSFFAGNLNKIYIALILLMITALLPSMLLGPGRISLDYKHALRRARKTFRG